jgi:quinol monooxygenase YgiN
MILRLIGAAMSAALLLAAAPARAQDAGATYVVSYVEVAPWAQHMALPLLRKLREASRKEAGNAGFEVLQRIGQPQHFIILESWKDAKAQAAHVAASASWREELKPNLVAPIDERAYGGYAVDASNAVTTGAVYAVTHIDLIGTKKDEGLAALKQLKLDSMKETSVLLFNIWQQNSRPNHLTLIEIWRGTAALERHEIAEHTRKFREALLPMSGSLYDQRLYQAMKDK